LRLDGYGTAVETLRYGPSAMPVSGLAMPGANARANSDSRDRKFHRRHRYYVGYITFIRNLSMKTGL
jgi:hypothetical protein